MAPNISPPQVVRLPVLGRDLSRLSARNLRRPTQVPRSRPLNVVSYLDRLKWLFSGSGF
jgi:hypothetical protein